MSRDRAIVRLLAVFATVALVPGCRDGPTTPPTPEPARPTTLRVSPAAAELPALGATVQLTAEVRDQNARVMAGVTVRWSSSDTSVAAVDASGLVTGVGAGTATITASAGSGQGTAEITVHDPQRAALEALYEATDGPNWTNANNWLTDTPLGEWYRVAVDASGRVVGLDIDGNGLSGPLPPELGDLTSLTELSLQNNGLSGPLPPELGNLTNLKALYLTGNNLSGPIPPELGNLTSLQSLSLRSNNLSGPLPPELGGLASLVWLYLSRNGLTGPIPESILQIDRLKTFRFDENAGLCAPGTSEFVTRLEVMGTFQNHGAVGPYCNEADVAVLEALYGTSGGPDWKSADGWLETPALEEWYGVATDSLGQVAALDLARNGLEGRLPADLGNLAALTRLRVEGNALSGRLPLSLANLDLVELHYAGTDLCVPGDPSFQTWLYGIASHEGTDVECDHDHDRDREALEAVYDATDGPNWHKADNWLTDAPLGEWSGVRADAAGRVIGLDLRINNLSGPIPPEIGDLARLTHLDLHGNNLSGLLPPEIGNLAGLTGLVLRVNELSGPLPPEIGNLTSLISLDASGNELSGPLPPEIGDLASLTALRLYGNNLSGPIPPEIAKLTRLTQLWLDDNELSGPIPPEIGDLTSLTHLHLVNNQLSGPIPSEIGEITGLVKVDVRINELSGPIPPEIGNLPSLRELALDRNRLTGPIPREFENLANLVRLTVEDNTGLSGSLPADLVYLRHLDTLLAGGTDLCAPRDPGFQYWLRGIGRSSVAPCALPVGCDPNSPGPSISGAMRNRLPPFPPPEEWTINEIWADIARQVPGGWGGFFIGDDQPIHYLVHPERQDDALAALRELGVTSPFTTREPAVLQARWDFAQLYDWRTYIFVALGWPDGLVSVDIDEFRNRLSYGVEDVEAAESLAAAFEAANLPCALTIIEVTGPVMAY